MAEAWRISLKLDDGRRESFTAYEDAKAGELAVVAVVRGPHPGPATRGVFARWVVHDPRLAADFEASRVELFNLRREHIGSFVCDLLLRSTGAEGDYVVVGLYADDDGLALARAHPKIAEWAQHHPVSDLSAEDVSGMQIGDVTLFAPP